MQINFPDSIETRPINKSDKYLQDYSDYYYHYKQVLPELCSYKIYESTSNKCSAVTGLDDSLATIDMGQKLGRGL